ncbi:MAG TPA: BON domain-containing protein [Armatimonadota bacterium]|jgi:osmotically-inducible protein OsmY
MGVLADIGLTLRVKSALLADERAGAGSINVDTRDGVVYLSGRVPNGAIRQLAEDIARSHGAHTVVNSLSALEEESSDPYLEDLPPVTTPEGAPEQQGPRLEEQVKAALEADDRVNPHLVEVVVDHRVAFLSGRQETAEAHDAAVSTAAHVPGVLAVQDSLDVKPSV